MRDVIVSGIGIVVVFGVVIFVHELGHFLAAKAVGVYAPRFSIGFGPALWRMRRGETEYVLAALPLGGYVRMASRHDEATAWIEGGSENEPPPVATVGADGATKIAQEEYPEGWDPNAMRPFGPKPIPEHRWFESKPLPARLLILFAGVTMNVLLSLGIVTGIFAIAGQPVPASRVVGIIADTTAPGRLLAPALSPGDTILRIDGRPVANWSDVRNGLRGARDSVRLETSRGVSTVVLTGGVRGEALASSVDPEGKVLLDAPQRGGAGDRAGLRAGDRVLAVDGTPLRSTTEFIRRIQAAPGRRIVLSIERDGRPRDIAVVPDTAPASAATGGASRVTGLLGVGVGTEFETAFEPIPLRDAISRGWDRTWEMGALIFTYLGRLGSGDVPLSELGGPVAIGMASAQAAQAGPVELLLLIAFLSINVAVLNILPIPILDGGQILLNVVESAKGSEFSPRTREYILRFGLVAILVLFAIVLFNDTSRLVDFVRGIWN
jgi:regulator of sigma E protease